MTTKFKNGIVCGVFDKLHEGHRFFLWEASKRTEKCTAVVARDAVIELLKNKKPSELEEKRLANVLASGCIAHAELGDEELGAYDILRRVKPDVIFLGYDQETLQRNLEEKMSVGAIPTIPLIVLEAHEPRRYHTSLFGA